jgi:transcriptional regulator with XRE-family HTH domain
MDDGRTLAALGQRLIELRRERGMTQEQLAAAARIDARDLRRVEGGGNTTVTTLLALARALGVGAGDLFTAPTQVMERRPGRPTRTSLAEPQAAEPPRKAKRRT